MNRTCHDCGESRPFEEFAVSRECQGGRGWQCKACRAVRWQAFANKKRAERDAIPRPQPPSGNWRDVSPIHAVSDDGRLWSYRHKRLLRGIRSRDGYVKVPIGGKQPFLHRLVAEAFVPGSGEQVRHIDGNKANNAASNLEWGSCRDNILDKWKHGKMVIGERHHCHKVPLSEVPFIRKSAESNTALARKYGVTRSAIYNIRKGVSYGWL